MGIQIAQPDPIGDALKLVFATNDGREFAAWCSGLAARQSYSRAARTFETVAVGRKNKVGWLMACHLIENLLSGGEIRFFRVAVECGLVPPMRNSGHVDFFSFLDILNARDCPARRLTLACFGYCSDGKPWTDSSPLPTDKRERAALALHLLLRAVRR